MRTLWKGAISFGLVTIPVSLYPATRKEELKFRMLRKSDLSPINYKRVAEADGKEVPWEEIVKGYEHEKGKYVILKEEDFAYRDALENLIEEKIEHGDKVGPAPSKKKQPSNVVDLVSVLQESIQQSQGKAKADKPVTKARAKSRPAPGKKQAA